MVSQCVFLQMPNTERRTTLVAVVNRDAFKRSLLTRCAFYFWLTAWLRGLNHGDNSLATQPRDSSQIQPLPARLVLEADSTATWLPGGIEGSQQSMALDTVEKTREDTFMPL